MTMGHWHRPDAKYVVKDGHTLGVIFDSRPEFMDVLASNKGGHHHNGGFVNTFGADIRPATEEDFKVFRMHMPSDATLVDGYFVEASAQEDKHDVCTNC